MIKISRRSQPRASISARDMGRKPRGSTVCFVDDLCWRELFIRNGEHHAKTEINQTKRAIISHWKELLLARSLDAGSRSGRRRCIVDRSFGDSGSLEYCGPVAGKRRLRRLEGFRYIPLSNV